MQRLVKRTLAFLLVVCMMCGMLVMSASAVIATPNESGNFVYDFTTLGDAPWDITADVISPGAGYCNLLPDYYTTKVLGNSVIPALYDNGYYTFMNKGEQKTTTKDLNWKVSGASHNWSGYGDNVQAGGPHYRYNMPSGAGVGTDALAYDGLMYIPGGADTRYYVGGWFSVTLKTPYVGAYSVTLEYTKTTSAAKQGSVYILPGTPSESEIDAAIAAGTGKMANTVNYNGATSTGNTITLGNVNIDEICEEYTVVFTSDLDVDNKTAADYEVGTKSAAARLYVDKLTLTPVAESADTAPNVLYNFAAANAYGFTSGDSLADATVAAKLDENYATSGWDYLGTTFTGAATINKYSALYGWCQFMASGTNGYVAFKMKSPGDGNYKLDMTGCAYGAPSTDETAKNGKTTHLWMDAYIVKLDDAMSEADYAQYLANAEKIGTYNPDYKTYAEQSQDADSSKLDFAKRMHTDEITAGYEFEEGAEYILYLQRSPDADTAQNTENCNYSPVNAYISSIEATYIPKTVATIGEDFTPPADEVYDFNLNAQDSTTFANGTDLANVLTEISDLYATNGWDYLGSDPQFYARVYTTSSGLQFNGMGTAAEPSYAAFKIKSPGDGEYTLDFTTYIAAKYSEYKVDGVVQHTADLIAHLWMNVYLVKVDPSMTFEEQWAVVSQGEPTGEYAPEYTTRTGLGLVTEDEACVTFDFDEGAEYILVLERHQDADTSNKDTDAEDKLRTYSPNNIYLNAITAKSTAVATSAEKFTTLTAALAGADAGETIKLQSDVLLTAVECDNNVTLDLNGYTLTTAAIAPTVKVVGEGLVKTNANADTFKNADMFAENTLPLYDADAMGYKFYEYSLGNGVAIADEANDAVKFWYQFRFTGDKADEAYTLVASGTSGLTMGVTLGYNGETTDCDFVNSKEAGVENDAAAFAAAYAAFAKTATDPWLYVNVRGVSGVEGLSVTPVINVGGTYVTGAAIAQ